MEKLKNALKFLRKNWYAALMTLTMFLIAIGVVGTWAGFGVPFMVFFTYLSVKIIKGGKS